MKKTTLLLFLFVSLLGCSGCSNSSDANDEDENVNPDIYLKMEASGSESFEVEFELKDGVAGEYSANGAWTSNVALLQIAVLDLTPGWQLVMNVHNGTGVEEGTYELNTTTEGIDISSFLNASQTEAYLSIGGELKITHVEELVRPGPGESDYIDGTFEIDFVEADAHPADESSMTISGEFRGIHIGSNYFN